MYIEVTAAHRQACASDAIARIVNGMLTEVNGQMFTGLPLPR